MTYRRAEVKSPRLSGLPLKAFVSALESGLGPALIKKLVTDSGLEIFRATSAGNAPPLQVPLPHPRGGPREIPTPFAQMEQVVKGAGAPMAGDESLQTVASFARAYREGRADPVAVARRLNTAIEQLDGGDNRMGFFISRKPDEVLRDAEASTLRLRGGQPRSALEGVPVVVKDEVDLAGFPTTLGTKFLTQVVAEDSVVVARLRAAGAVILGKANMNEIGINPVGLNPHHGVARNPWNRSHITGGSSSGSAATVAAGLCPLAVGADGGGSIRIPAALCGVVGLKATWGRIPETGVPPLCWTVGHVGPIGLTVDDVAVGYAVMSGADSHDLVSQTQPPAHLASYGDASLQGIRVGLCHEFLEDAEPAVVRHCQDAVRALQSAGALLVELPPPELNTILWSHAILILSEMATAMRPYLKEDSSRFALDSRTNLAIGNSFRSTDYLHALRHRHLLTREYLELMRTVDVVVTPTTACSAPAIPEHALPEGESNLEMVDGLMRFIRVANLTGFPALSVPAGFDAKGLPVGVQLLGRPWEEHLLLRLGRVIEATVERRVPSVHVKAL